MVYISGRIAVLASNSGLMLYMELCGQSVGLLVMVVSPTKIAEPIEMPFGTVTWAGQSNHVLNGGALYGLWCVNVP